MAWDNNMIADFSFWGADKASWRERPLKHSILPNRKKRRNDCLSVCLSGGSVLFVKTYAYVSVLHQFCVQAVTKVRMHLSKILHLKGKEINYSTICS